MTHEKCISLLFHSVLQGISSILNYWPHPFLHSPPPPKKKIFFKFVRPSPNNYSSIFICFFILCKYRNEPQIITKIVCGGVYSMSTNIYILLCIDYSQAFFPSLTSSNVAKDLICKEKIRFELTTKHASNEQVMIICNAFNVKWSL